MKQAILWGELKANMVNIINFPFAAEFSHFTYT